MIQQVHDELSDLMWQREQIRMVGKMIDESAELRESDKPFLWEVRRWYMVFASMAVRRQTDRRSDVVCLHRLLLEITLHPECITRNLFLEPFLSVHPQADKNHEADVVDFLWGKWKAANGSLDVSRVRRDLNSLQVAPRPIADFANEALAHTSKHSTEKEFGLTFKHLDAAIDHLESLAVEYYSLLTGRGYSTFLPTPQFDWNQQFTFAWKPRKEQA